MTADQTHSGRLYTAFDLALDRYALTMDEAFPASVRLSIETHDGFQALAVPDGDGIHVIVSTGVVDAVQDVWHRAIAHSDTLPDDTRLNVGDVDQAIDASLMWLMLHELHHCEMGHFKLAGPAGIAETSLHGGFALTTRSHRPVEVSPLDTVTPAQRLLFERCMELQADHDATEMTLDAWSTDGWDILRFYAAAIFAVMVLIEREENTSHDVRTHPRAATRIFQLLGHLSFMWMDPHRVSNSDVPLPAPDIVEAFNAAVVAPALSDAIVIARANGAAGVINGFGSVDDFLHDVAILAMPDAGDVAHLKTTGAREYAELLPVNASLVSMLGADRFFG